MANQIPQSIPQNAVTVSRDGIRSRIKPFGFERVAEEAGIKAYQTLMKYCEGGNVRPSTENQILGALERLEAQRIRQNKQINNTSNEEGFQVVPLSKFNALEQQVEYLAEQMKLLMSSQLAAHQWVSSDKAATILNCSLVTLYRRKQAGELEFRGQGKKTAYNIEGLMRYLKNKHFKPEVIQQRIITALSS